MLQAAKENVLLITIDTLRADRLGCYGNRAIHTPNLDRLASASLFFENAVCQAPLTLPSHTSLMTGRYPYHHGVHDNAGTLNPKETTLAEILHQKGYHTYAFVGGFPLDHRFGLNQGFDVYNDFFPRERNKPLDFRSERTADHVVEAVRETALAQPFFVWVHFYDPHAPYLNGGYNGEIQFVDQQIGELMKLFPREDLTIAVAGDHGESLGEHGESTHRIFVYDSTMHVPFFIASKGMAPQKIKQQVRLIDFLPTLLALLKIRVPADIDGAALPANAGRFAYLESLFPNLQLGWSALSGIRTDEWKYIESPHPELYNLRSDPQEKQNLYSANPKIVKALRAQMRGINTNNQRSKVSPEMAERLASLGYVSSGRQSPQTNVDPKDRIAVWNQIERAVDLEPGKPQDAIAILEQARKADPTNPMVLGFLAQKYGETNRIDEAKQILKSVIAEDPHNTLALYRMSLLSLRAGHADEAKKWAVLLQKADASSSDAFILQARANLKLGEIAQAASNLKRALGIDPADEDIRVDLGNIYLQSKQENQAQVEFQKSLKQDPKNVQALNGLATCLYLKHDYAGSEAELKRALIINPADTQTKMNLALLYSNTGRKQQAIQLYQEVESSDQAPADWKTEARARLQELQQ